MQKNQTMETILEYNIDHEQKIILEKLQGKIELNELLEHEKMKLTDPEYNDTYSIMIDIRDLDFPRSEEEMEIIYRMFEDIGNRINMNRKCALVTHKPSEVVASELFSMRMKSLSPMVFRIFSTEKSALGWIKEYSS